MRFHLIALACASSVAADYVVDWRVPQANDANANAWVADVVVPAGEKVVLEWTDYFAFHNVFRMKDEAAFDACDFTGAVELAPSAATGSVTIDATETTT
jgi:ATP phosphoribosyltransferase